jgi:excisionase family DNA binding protein
MENLTLETLPKAFTQLASEVSEIKRMLEQKVDSNKIESDKWFNLLELCEYHPDKPSKATVYDWVYSGEVPVHKTKKKLRFLKSEIDQWLKQGKRKTLLELDKEVENKANLKK